MAALRPTLCMRERPLPHFDWPKQPVRSWLSPIVWARLAERRLRVDSGHLERENRALEFHRRVDFAGRRRPLAGLLYETFQVVSAKS